MAIRHRNRTTIERLETSAHTIPTDRPESDGTLEWDSTTIVIVKAHAGGLFGLGYSYAAPAAAALIDGKLAGAVIGLDAMDVPCAWHGMVGAVRNLGRAGLCSAAISAVDNALWDLKARLLDVPLAALLGAARDAIPVYGSGGFTSYAPDELAAQLAGWARRDIGMVKMKVGREPSADADRVRRAREAIGPDVALFVDANGAYDCKQALAMAVAFAACDVAWFEEPVSSDDLDGLRLLRDRAPAGMAVAAGEYGYDLVYFRRMLAAGAVDVLQADATRCGGITGFLAVGALAQAFGIPLSAHTAPNLHAHPCCALPHARHVEYFHDHARIEEMLFEGALRPVGGALRPDPSRPGMGLTLRDDVAAAYAA